MSLYQVSVIVEVLWQKQHPSEIAILPEQFELNRLVFTRSPGEPSPQTTYHGITIVEAPEPKDAASVVLRMSREALWLFAVSNESFVVSLEAVQPAGPDASTPVITTRDTAGRFNVAVRNDADFERLAFSRRTNWEPWLLTCLELNYFAVTAREVASALVVHWSILELIARHKVGTALVLNALKKPDKTSLIAALKRELLKVLSTGAADRIIAHLRETQEISLVARLQTALSQLGVDASEENIRWVSSERNKVAHGSASDTEVTKRVDAERLARGWVQSALRRRLAVL